MTLEADERKRLLEVAEASIRHGLEFEHPIKPNPGEYPQHLRDEGACFVSLHRRGDLRGCIGSLEARRPLVNDVAENAFAAAFFDPRFPPLTQSELTELDIEISVLSAPLAMEATSEQDLLRQLQPGIDGLVLEERGHRATFLPVVWEALPDPGSFLAHLKHKAGLSENYWSDTLAFSRYHTEAFGRRFGS